MLKNIKPSVCDGSFPNTKVCTVNFAEFVINQKFSKFFSSIPKISVKFSFPRKKEKKLRKFIYREEINLLEPDRKPNAKDKKWYENVSNSKKRNKMKKKRNITCILIKLIRIIFKSNWSTFIVAICFVIALSFMIELLRILTSLRGLLHDLWLHAVA